MRDVQNELLDTGLADEPNGGNEADEMQNIFDIAPVLKRLRI